VQRTVHCRPVAPDARTLYCGVQMRPFPLRWVLACGVGVAASYAGAVYAHARSLEVRESRLEADLARAQLDALRLEIEPHFLFDTLNAIASFIRSRANDRALAMLLGLGDLMRESIDSSHQHTTTLGAELAFVQRYIYLQRVRFMDRLTVHYDAPAGCESSPVPSFLLQPLVENAFRHGIARRPGQCRLQIFVEALARAKQRVLERRLASVATELQQDDATAEQPSRYLDELSFRDSGRRVVIKTANVTWIEAEDYYVMIHSSGGNHPVRASIASLEQRLGPAVFVRTHRAAIVNLGHVRQVSDRDGLCLTLSDGSTVGVSRARKQQMEAVLQSRGSL
jgi:hypothetical protein